MKIINLADSLEYVAQYVTLRNAHAKALLTHLVTEEETLWWLHHAKVDVEVALRNEELIGAVVLYLDKNAEVTIFTKYAQEGIGGELLQYMLAQRAPMYQLTSVWVWVACENRASLALFSKYGFHLKEEIFKENGCTRLKGVKLEYVY